MKFNLFKSNKTKWIPFGTYRFSQSEYIVFVRGNKKTGMLYFKTKKIQGHFGNLLLVPFDMIDVKMQWRKINNMLDE